MPTCTNTGRHQHQVRPGEGRPRGATTREPDGTEPFAASPLPITRGRPLKLRQTPTTRRPPSRSSLPGRSNAFCIFSRPSSRRCRPPGRLLALVVRARPHSHTTRCNAHPSCITLDSPRAWPPPALLIIPNSARWSKLSHIPNGFTYRTVSARALCDFTSRLRASKRSASRAAAHAQLLQRRALNLSLLPTSSTPTTTTTTTITPPTRATSRAY